MKNSMTLPKRRGSFLEVGNGKLGRELQSAYEEAAQRAYATGSAVTVTAKILVRPPERGVGAVSYELGVTSSKRKSILFETEVDATGTIIATAPMDIGVMQESLYFDNEDEVVEETIQQ